MSENKFSAPVHSLRWPIKDGKGQPLSLVTFRTLTVKQHHDLTEEYKGDDKGLDRAVICASTGLALDDIARLVTADFNTIKHQVFTLTGSKSSDFLGGKFDVDSPVLLVPFKGADGKDRTQYALKPPTVAATDLMDTYTSEWDKTLFISANCSGFSSSEIESMSLPDFNQLQERLIDFLQNSADFFPLETLKS